MLRVNGLRKTYGRTEALRGVDLCIEPAQICALLGPNGAGKSTLISIVAGLMVADAGSVEVRGRLGLVPQEIGVYPTLSVHDNLRFYGELHGLRRRALRARIDDVVSATLLAHLLDRDAGRLSGGEKRRLHTAAALLHNPDVLLLDEPTAASDLQTRTALLDLVRDLADDGTAICYTTHYLPEVEQLDATVNVIDRGQIVAAGTVAELTARSAPPYIEMVLHDGQTVRAQTDQPAAAIAQLDPHADRLQSLEIIRPTLESVYLSLTTPSNEGLQP